MARITDLPEEGALVVEHRAHRIAIFCEGERYYAIEDICPHMGAFLSRGFREPGVVICPWHNWRFSIHTGRCIEPDTGDCVQTFEVEVVNGEIRLPARLSEEYLEEFDEFE